MSSAEKTGQNNEEKREEQGQKGEKKKENKRLGVGTRQAYQKLGKVFGKEPGGRNNALLCRLSVRSIETH